MTVDPPRRKRPDAERRNNTIATETRGAPSAKGSTAAARPVTTTRQTQTYVPPRGLVVIGQAGVGATAIESTGSDPTSSTTAADGAVVVGSLSTGGTGSAVVGRDASVTGDYCARVGFSGGMSGSHGVGLGYAVSVTGDNAGAVGSNTQALANGAWAIGTDSGSAGATASNANEIALGTANHIVIIAGKLVIADGSGGLHQIVVSTGGALSTVAYP